jgi:hypothetical protein
MDLWTCTRNTCAYFSLIGLNLHVEIYVLQEKCVFYLGLVTVCLLWFEYKTGKILYEIFLCNSAICNGLVHDLELVAGCMPI